MRIPGVAALMLLAGCTVGPDFKRPAPPVDTSYTPDPLPAATAAARTTAGASQRFVSGIDLPGEWWKLFHSPPLNALVEQALKGNPNITAARAALRQAHETVLAQRGDYYPQLAAGLSASRNLTPIGSVSPASASGNPYYSLITPQLSVSFVPDIFGANRRSVESLAAQAENQEFQLEATYLTLTSNVVAAAVQEASLRGQIAAAGETVRIEGDLLGILHRQMALGQVALAQAKQVLPPLQRQLAQQRDQIAVLAGLGPGAAMPERFELGALDLPVDLPVSLPSKLIEQRPDIRAAEATLHAASAQIGVAVAARLPQITLSGAVGGSANQLSTLFTPGNNFWTLSAGLTQPIFQGGMLLHKQRAAEAAFDQAAASYRATVLTGMQNVADTLHALVSDADALQAAVAAEAAARRSLEITRQQLKLGQIAYLALLNAEQTYQQARLSLVQARANRFADTAALFQSVGGGWWDRADVAEVDNKVTRQ
jgi:NodT family efflux transporter outer membrane factor (OMF) lipoprotein